MHPAFLQHLFSDEVIQAICWTLIHSLWEGLLLAIVCGVVIIITRKSGSAMRYNLLSGLFFLFMLVAGITFNRELNLASGNDLINVVSANNFTGTKVAGQHVETSSFVATGQTYIEKIVIYLNTHASLVVAIWFIIFSARCVRLLSDLGYAHRIRHYKTHVPSVYWQARINKLAKSLQIKKRIIFLESEIVKVPMMTGFLKPVVLFPFSMITQLPAEQVEAVLLHELAHIKRKDYFVNLVQSFGEIIFFFNPAVLWISSLIRDERENCCDDIAIQHTKNKKQLIHALVAFQEFNLENSGYAIAFPGKKNQLLQRVKRIIYNDNKTLNIMQKIFLVSGLILTCLLTVVFAQNKKQSPVKPVTVSVSAAPVKPVALNKTVPSAVEAIAVVPDAPVPVATVQSLNVNIEKDTLPESIDDESFRGIIERTVEGKKYEIVFIHGKVTELYIDNKRIPDAKIPDYQNTIDKIIKETKEERAKGKMDAEHAYTIASKEKVTAENAEKMAEMQKKSAEDAKLQLDKVLAESAYKMAESKEAKEQAEVEKMMAEEAKEKSEKDKLMAEDMINGIISDMKNDGIVKDEKNVSFSLNKNGFIVNGVKQSQSLHSKYKKKYMKNDNARLEFSKAGSSTHISFQDNK